MPRKANGKKRTNPQALDTIGKTEAQLADLAKAKQLVLPEEKPRIRYKMGQQRALVLSDSMCNLLMSLAAEGYTQVEIATFLGIGERTLSTFLATNPEARDALDRGTILVHASLRRQQIKQALAGDATMLIWLGKQYLGQKDQRHVTATGTVTHAHTVSETRRFLEQEAIGFDAESHAELVSDRPLLSHSVRSET